MNKHHGYNFYRAVERRRSIYSLNKKIDVSDERIEEIISDLLKYCPSGFNSQTTRVVLLKNEKHKKFWDITAQILKEITKSSDEDFKQTQQKLDGFSSGYATILVYIEASSVQSLQEKFPLYSEKFPSWASDSAAMFEILLWSGLEIEGLGLTLQHYNPVIDDAVAKEFDIPNTWQLVAQMPFGGIAAPPNEKEFNFKKEHFKILG